MKRLTKRDEFENADIIGVDSEDLQLNLEFDELNKVTDALNKLAAYEDAEEQGRLVVLPCKVGDTVYKLCKLSPHIKIGDMCDGKIVKTNCDKCCYGSCGCAGIIEKEPNAITELPNRSINWIWAHRNDFGKAIFLTREAAENALKEG